MSVSIAINPEIDLYIPSSPLGSSSPVGKWRGQVVLAADASGGNVTMDITSPSPAVAGLYMWSLEDWQFTDSPTSGPEFGVLEWETGDPVVVGGVSVVFVLRTSIVKQGVSVATANSANYYETTRWRYVARPRGFNIRWRVTGFPNTNLHSYLFSAWGYIWNQEYAKVGPVHRPVT